MMGLAPIVGRMHGTLVYAVPLTLSEWTKLQEKPGVVDWLALPTSGPPSGGTVVVIATPDPEHFGWEKWRVATVESTKIAG